MTTDFEYLLNAMERAAQEGTPADHGYGEKRKAVLDYVAALRDDTLRECAQIADDAREDAEGDVRVVRDRIRALILKGARNG